MSVSLFLCALGNCNLIDIVAASYNFMYTFSIEYVTSVAVLKAMRFNTEGQQILLNYYYI